MTRLKLEIPIKQKYPGVFCSKEFNGQFKEKGLPLAGHGDWGFKYIWNKQRK